MSKYEDLRDILILMQYSDLHKDWNTEDICKCILVPVMLNQYKVVRKKSELLLLEVINVLATDYLYNGISNSAHRSSVLFRLGHF